MKNSNKKDLKKLVKTMIREEVDKIGLLPEAIKKGDYVMNPWGDFGIVNKVKGRVAYVKFDSDPGSFHPYEAAALVKSNKKHKGKDLYHESVNEKMRPAVNKLLKQKGYSPIFQAIDKSKRQFKQMGYTRGEIQDTLIDMFGDEDSKILQKIKEGRGSYTIAQTIKDVQNAKIGAKASGGGYSPFTKIKNNSWKNIKTGRLVHDKELIKRLGGFDDFIVEGKLTEAPGMAKSKMIKLGRTSVPGTSIMVGRDRYVKMADNNLWLNKMTNKTIKSNAFAKILQNAYNDKQVVKVEEGKMNKEPLNERSGLLVAKDLGPYQIDVVVNMKQIILRMKKGSKVMTGKFEGWKENEVKSFIDKIEEKGADTLYKKLKKVDHPKYNSIDKTGKVSVKKLGLSQQTLGKEGVNESTKQWHNTIKAMARKKQLDSISAKDKETLLKIVRLIKTANEEVLEGEVNEAYYVWSGTYGKDDPRKMKDLVKVKDLDASIKQSKIHNKKHGNVRAMLDREFQKKFPKAFKSLNEISTKAGLADVIKGRTTSIEGIKMSKELAEAILYWIQVSPYGRKYGKHILKGRIASLIGPANAMGIADRLPGKLKAEWKALYAKHGPKKEAVLEQLQTLKEANFKLFRDYLAKIGKEMGDKELIKQAKSASDSKLKQMFNRDLDYKELTDKEVKTLSGKKLHDLIKYDDRFER